jgi:hypothetical protein
MGILTDDMQRLIREQRLAFVASVRADGTPSLSPKATTRVYDADHLTYLDIASPGTRANIAANPAVEINVIDHILRRGYRFRGKARLLTEGAQYERSLQLFEHALELFAELEVFVTRSKGVVLIRVESATPLLSPAYAVGRSAAELAEEFSAYYAELAAERIKSAR